MRAAQLTLLSESIQRKLQSLPAKPGVYLFLGQDAKVLYVGKATSLRSRVRSYFAAGSSDQRFFIERLQRELVDLQTFVLANEKEAALLENELIKDRRPRYNVKLKDDKDFLSIRIDDKESWPRLRVVRRPRPDGARYYGPYDSASSARQTLRLVNRFFNLRTCREAEFKSRVRPCLQYQIKRCPGPCVREVDSAQYLAQVRLVGLFLDGRQEELSQELEGKMSQAAAKMEYEAAARYRDQLQAISKVRSGQRVSAVRDVDQDAVGLYRAGDQAEVALLQIRSGRMRSVQTFALSSMRLPDDELLSGFLSAYYGAAAQVPDEILLPTPIEASTGLAEWLSERRGKRALVLFPQRGDKRRLIEMAEENAAHAYHEKNRAQQDVSERLRALQTRLRLPILPQRIECIDVSHLGGQDAVAVISVLIGGELSPSNYRTFRIKSAAAGDDYGAMYEVLKRRFLRAEKAEAGWEAPDLFVLDGGRGQLSMGLAALADLGITSQNIVALAKERSERGVDERVFVPGQKNPISLPPRSPSRHFLTLLRDEAHRASNNARVKMGRRRQLRSGLDDVPGVGAKTRAKLLRNLGSLKAVAAADEAALVGAGANRKQAAAIIAMFTPTPLSPVGTRDGEPAEAQPSAAESAESPADDKTIGQPDAEQEALDNAFSLVD